jgi:hypothetical protein
MGERVGAARCFPRETTGFTVSAVCCHGPVELRVAQRDAVHSCVVR